jgi:hypothetical protein
MPSEVVVSLRVYAGEDLLQRHRTAVFQVQENSGWLVCVVFACLVGWLVGWWVGLLVGCPYLHVCLAFISLSFCPSVSASVCRSTLVSTHVFKLTF